MLISDDTSLSSEGSEEESDESELVLLRKTVSIMNRMIASNASQFTYMAARIESLEDDVASLKRKHCDEEPMEERPYIKQKIIIGDTVTCKECGLSLDLGAYDKTSTRRKDKVYEYRRSICKDCTKAKRVQPKKKKG